MHKSKRKGWDPSTDWEKTCNDWCLFKEMDLSKKRKCKVNQFRKNIILQNQIKALTEYVNGPKFTFYCLLPNSFPDFLSSKKKYMS